MLQTYAPEISTTSGANSTEELVFAPTAPQFEGKVIAFAARNGKVEAFIAGLRQWATFPLPCPA
ncbi:hypothetical protein [Streptomyces chryseus]